MTVDRMRRRGDGQWVGLPLSVCRYVYVGRGGGVCVCVGVSVSAWVVVPWSGPWGCTLGWCTPDESDRHRKVPHTPFPCFLAGRLYERAAEVAGLGKRYGTDGEGGGSG